MRKWPPISFCPSIVCRFLVCSGDLPDQVLVFSGVTTSDAADELPPGFEEDIIEALEADDQVKGTSGPELSKLTPKTSLVRFTGALFLVEVTHARTKVRPISCFPERLLRRRCVSRALIGRTHLL